MKAILEFNLPEETWEHQTAVDGPKWRSVVNEFTNNLRHEMDYGNLSPDALAFAERMRKWIFQELSDNNLSHF